MLGLGLASCQDQLDIPQKSVLDYGAYYAEAGDTEADQLIAAVYSNYYSAVMGIEHNILLDVLSDDHHVGGGGVSDNANQFRNAGNFIMTSAESKPSYTLQYRFRRDSSRSFSISRSISSYSAKYAAAFISRAMRWV